MKNYSKGFAPLILLVIIAVVAIGGGYYYVHTKKSVETSSPVASNINTKNYSDNQFNIEFKYPNNFTAEKKVQEDGKPAISLKNPDGFYNVWIYVDDKNEAGIKDMISPIAAGPETTRTNLGTKTYNNLEWRGYEDQYSPTDGKGTASSVATWYTLQGNTVYVVECLNCSKEMFGDTAKPARDAFDVVVSTFKFTQ